MIDQLHSLFRDVYAYLSLGPDDSITIAPGTDLLIAVICLILVLLIAWLANLIVKGFVLGVVRSLAKKNQNPSWGAFS